MITVKGGIIIDAEGESLFLNASTFMINRFVRNVKYELPKPQLCPFGTDIYEFKTQHASLILTSKMELFDLQMPYVKKEQTSQWSLEGLRFPLILLSFGGVTVY